MERQMDNDEILNEIQRLLGFYPRLGEEILTVAITLHFTSAPPSDKWLVLEQEIRRRLSQTYLEQR
jgi:hypothetical protein